MTKGTPANISQLVKDANNKSSWKIRLAALNELKQYDCQQSRDVITRLALHPCWCAFPLCSCWQSYLLSYQRQALNPLFSYHALTVCARVVYSWCAYCFPAFLSIPPGRLPRQELFSYYNTNLVKSQFILVACRWYRLDWLFLSFCSL